MFNDTKNGPMGSDCTACYRIDIPKEWNNKVVTIEEFIRTRPYGEWGFIKFNSKGHKTKFFDEDNINFEYNHQHIRIPFSANVYDQYKDYIIDGIQDASGGWSRMDYILTAHRPVRNRRVK